LEDKKATVEIEGLCTVDCITFQFRQLLQNLITNSLKFSKPGIAPHITLKSRYIKYSEANSNHLPQKLDYCHISYSDNGIGFNSEYNSRIFELFQRLNDKKDYEGTGIGLTIVKKIVQNHNGIITATGNLGIGSTFDIYIPIHQK
jgi:signal transduction histidine kinase